MSDGTDTKPTRFLDLDAMTRMMTRRHREVFGDQHLTALALKVCEEAGEIAGAVIRDNEWREGRSWNREIKGEIGDVVVTLMRLCGELDISLADAIDSKFDAFMGREWDNIPPPA